MKNTLIISILLLLSTFAFSSDSPKRDDFVNESGWVKYQEKIKKQENEIDSWKKHDIKRIERIREEIGNTRNEKLSRAASHNRHVIDINRLCLEKKDLEVTKEKLVNSWNKDWLRAEDLEEKWHKAVYEGYNKDYERAEDLNKRINQGNINIQKYNKYADDVLSPERKIKLNHQITALKETYKEIESEKNNPYSFLIDTNGNKVYGYENQKKLIEKENADFRDKYIDTLRRKTPRISKI